MRKQYNDVNMELNIKEENEDELISFDSLAEQNCTKTVVDNNKNEESAASRDRANREHYPNFEFIKCELVSDNVQHGGLTSTSEDNNAMDKDDPNSQEFQCSVCNKKFSQNYNLKKHMKIHTGIKDLRCTMCYKKFTENFNLKRHMKVHTGVKEFECKICKKKFSYSSTLKIHMKYHLGIQDFVCSVCHKKFTTSGNLKSHIKIIHEGKKDFECPICNKRYTTSSHLKTHVITHAVPRT